VSAGRLVCALVLIVLCRPCGAAQAPSDSAPLQAIFIEVDGKVRWRADEASAWRPAKVNDLLDAGSEIRTGLKSRATLRVGRNASVLVDAGTTFQLPTVVQEGATLRTVAAVKTGRVDFKVDQVGFANDFTVVTPETTLSVRGTGFGVNSGPLVGTQVTGARTNAIDAIELKYVASNLRYFLSGAAASESGRQDPVQNAWVSTLGPPQVVGTIVGNNQLEQAVSQGNVGNAPTNPTPFQQIAAAQTNAAAAEDIVSPLDDLLQDQARASALAQAAAHDVLPLANQARSAALAAEEAGAVRLADIRQVVELGEGLEERWTGDGGEESSLSGLASRSDDDLAEVIRLRGEMDAAIEQEDVQEAAVAALDAIGVVDDAWQEGLVASSRSIVQGIQTLQSELDAAMESASEADESFNALRDSAIPRVQLAQTAAAPLASLRAKVQAYRDQVRRAVASGQAGPGAARRLIRSTELLAAAVQRIEAALSATDAAAAALARARSLGERVLFAAAITASLRGEEIEAAAEGYRDLIEANAEAIESARFSAFFAAAASAVETISGQSQVSRDAGALAEADAQASRGLADLAETDVNGVIALADSLDAFWEGVGEGGQGSRVRMEELQSLSQSDLAAAADLLSQLNDAIGEEDAGAAGDRLASLLELNDRWGEQGDLLQEVAAIHGEVDRLDGLVQQAFAQARDGSHADFVGMLASAESQRDIALQAANRLEFLRDELSRYRSEYGALVAAGRGGEGVATQLQETIAAIEGVQQTLLEGLQASVAASEAVESARTYGEKVFFAAASQRAIDAASIAAASAALKGQIEQNAAGIRDTYTQGDANFQAAFGREGVR
jgi:hypothetical protein